MPTLADIYENHAEECLRAAAKADDPQQRALMLKLANAWRKDAEALKRGEKLQPASPRERQKHLGAVRKERRERHLHLSSCGVTRVEWGQTSVELYEPRAAKDDERVNFTFRPTHQDGTTVAACKFDGRVGQLQRWRCPGHHFERAALERP